MAVYSINRSGVEALSNLRAELYQAVNDIFEASERLKNDLNGLEDDLGIFYEHIMLENQKVILTLKKALDGEDGVGFLINNKLPKMISDIHYCEMLPLEYKPSEKYIEIYNKSLSVFAQSTADAVARVAEDIYKNKGQKVALISLARAGTSIGVLIKRWSCFLFRIK